MPSLKQRFTKAAAAFFIKRITNSEELRAILVGANNGSFTSFRFRPLAQAGFKDNDVGYFIISEISRAVSSIKLLLDGLPSNIQQLMNRPQQGKPWETWVYEQMVYRLIAGESYAEKIRIGSRIIELPIIRPDRIEPELGVDEEELLVWLVTRGAMQKRFDPDDIWFSKLLDPLRDWEGWGPLQAARKNIDNRNSISRLNKNVLDNNAAPFGILKVRQPKDGMPLQMSQDQLDNIQEKFNGKMETHGAKTVVVDWDYEFERIGQTGREMDFSKTDEADARKTALTFGFPAVLLGFAAGATFTNMREAREFLVLNTVLPHLRLILADLSMAFNLPEPIQPDVNNIPALADLVARRRESARKDHKAGIISVEEARKEGGYPEKVEGSLLLDPRFISIE